MYCSNPTRFDEAYLKRFPGYYSTEDGGMVDDDGYFYVMGRVGTATEGSQSDQLDVRC